MLILATEADFDAVYDIMQLSFPVDERRPYGAQKALFDNDLYRLYVEKQEDKVVGFISIWLLETPFIEHFAVAPSARGGGVGAAMLDEAIAACGTACLEVELPETEIARRRIAFYERHGFYLNRYAYEQPPLAKGQAWVPLLVMTHGAPVDKPAFEAIKHSLYSQVYFYDATSR